MLIIRLNDLIIKWLNLGDDSGILDWSQEKDMDHQLE